MYYTNISGESSVTLSVHVFATNDRLRGKHGISLVQIPAERLAHFLWPVWWSISVVR